jgi:hypothetical protein
MLIRLLGLSFLNALVMPAARSVGFPAGPSPFGRRRLAGGLGRVRLGDRRRRRLMGAMSGLLVRELLGRELLGSGRCDFAQR